MTPIDHLDLVVSSLDSSLVFPDQIKLEIVHRPAESDLVAEVRRLTTRLERLERERA